MRVVMLASLMIAAPLAAQECPLPAGLSAWGQLSSSGDILSVGHTQSIPLQLKPRYVLPPTKVVAVGSRGAAIAVSIARSGTYRVALGDPAWIDLVRDGRSIGSTAHAHGAACTGIAKIVDFRLSSGRYTLQLSGANQPVIKVLVARLP